MQGRIVALLTLAALLGISTPARAAGALVAHVAVASTNGGAGATTTAINATGGNLIVIYASLGTAIMTSDITDSTGSNTYTALSSVTSVITSQIFYAWNPTVSATMTWTLSHGSSFPSFEVLVFSGAQTSSDPFDVQNGNAPGASNTVQPGSITPNTSGEIIVSGLGCNCSSLPSIDSGFTVTDWEALNGGNSYGSAAAYFIQTSAASINPTWTEGSMLATGAVIGSFKVAAGSTPAPHFGLLGVGP